MGSQAATVDSLIKKGKFEPQVAMAIAEAIGNVMSDSQLVTVPILDARFADHRAETRADLMRLENKIDGVRTSLDSKIDSVRMDLEGRIELVRMELDNKIEVSAKTLDAKIDVAVAKLGEMNERTKAELVRWVFVTMAGSLVGGVASLLNVLLHH